MKKQLNKGSVTVEAALVMPLVLIILFLILQLVFFIHNKAWYTSVCSEALISASTQGVQNTNKADTTLSAKLSEHKGRQGFPSTVQMTTASGTSTLRAETKLRLIGSFPAKNFTSDISLKTEIIRPVPFIRNCMMLESIKEAGA